MTVMQLNRRLTVLPSSVGAAAEAGLAGFLRSNGVIVQLMRFAAVGGISNIAYFLLFLGMHSEGSQWANIAGTAVSTALANEMHRRLTFRADSRVGWFEAQWEGGGLMLLGLAVNAAALALLSFLFPGAGDVLQAGFVIGVGGLVGLMRFVALRGLWL
ncbi:GtrA family protein [Skermania sp. ID1734]|uniref:GtrA family protein n=1 Tax=Skermania sp. ID1734 TaxID=2597516 RepID=UPI0011811B7F|nr:GtrA family protein [Skermania sp. ID1734]TSD98106.1 GtrA family protein [Skermania sp. ID1734]